MKKGNFFKISSTRMDNTNSVPLVVKYHPSLKIMDQIINRNLHLLYLDQEVKKILTPKPMVYFCSTRKLSSCLVGVKLYVFKNMFS